MSEKSLLIVAATTGYQTRVFAETARKLGIRTTLATDRCHILDDPWHDQAIPVRFENLADSARELAGRDPFHALVAVGDRPAHLASLYAGLAGLPFHTGMWNKFEAREKFRAEGFLVPEYRKVRLDDSTPPDIEYPCVLKPLGLSASRGVIRADDAAEFAAAAGRIRAILLTKEVASRREAADRFILVERFIPGREYALEGIVTHGELQTLAIFDKPDPLDGPFFEETIYVAPSQGPTEAIIETTGRAVRTLGLTHGPIHAEMRVNEEGVWMLEVAGRPIGGLCAKALHFDPDWTLEELILRHALGEDVLGARLKRGATGVMMIPIPTEGIFRGVEGVDQEVEIVITAKEGQHFVPLPEGHSYLGFIFARGGTPGEVEAALRGAHAKLKFDFAPVLKTIA